MKSQTFIDEVRHKNNFLEIKGPSVKGFCTKLTDIGRLGGEGVNPKPLSRYENLIRILREQQLFSNEKIHLS